MKQSDLAALLNIGQATLSGYETEKFEADIETYKRIAQLFNVTLDYLLGGQEIIEPVILPAPYPEISDRYSRLDEIDRVKALAYIDGLLAGEKYSSSQVKRAAG